eukprot:11214622-Lingulodinium_polyedra.AAC.1
MSVASKSVPCVRNHGEASAPWRVTLSIRSRRANRPRPRPSWRVPERPDSPVQSRRWTCEHLAARADG